MKIHHYNTYPYGGAATAARRIHQGLVRMGIDSTFYFRINDRGARCGPTVKPVRLRNKASYHWVPVLGRKLEKKRQRSVHRLYDQHLAERTQGEHEVFAMARLPELTRLRWNECASDIVHLHWMAHMIDYPSFFESIPRGIPIVWTLHDMGPFTGGCHYSGTCRGFQTGCGQCPQIVNPGVQDVSVDSMNAKREALEGHSIHVVAPSTWLIDLAKQSPVWPEETSFDVIHYGLDLSRFRPYDQNAARAESGLPQGKVILGFGADDLSNERKGFGQLCEALRLVAGDNQGVHPEIELAVFGNGKIPEDLRQRFRIRSFGFVDRARTLARIYSACNLVLVPSLEDNQPQVGLEAMACGTPVLGFAAGGIPEYVIPNHTGQLVPARDHRALASEIVALSQNLAHCRKMGANARAKVVREFEVVSQTREYVQFYQSLMQDRARRAA